MNNPLPTRKKKKPIANYSPEITVISFTDSIHRMESVFMYFSTFRIEIQTEKGTVLVTNVAREVAHSVKRLPSIHEDKFDP